MSWETEILCRRLNIEQGIVSMRVALRYDLLRFSPRSCRFVHLDENSVLILYGYIFTLKSAWNNFVGFAIEQVWSISIGCASWSLFFSQVFASLGSSSISWIRGIHVLTKFPLSLSRFIRFEIRAVPTVDAGMFSRCPAVPTFYIGVYVCPLPTVPIIFHCRTL